MIKTILIDDEQECLDVLEMELKSYCSDILILSKCLSGEEGIRAIGQFNPELVFLDISMPNMNGFAMLSKLEKYNFDVIFVTAYDSFALTAFEFCAIDYLLKPVLTEKLIRAVERVREKHKKPINVHSLELLLANMRAGVQVRKTVAVPTVEGLEFIATDDIIYIEADSSYTWINLVNQEKIIVSRTLKDIELLLKGQNFARIHQSYLVNLQHVKRYVKGDNGTLVMNNGKLLQVSRANKVKLMNLVKLQS
ncbi:MAG: LytTR family DNA-binding domain-containing protein [Spirosomaceae bacterium]|jgi:two-component system LytT family response regulator|nr:LytTR family DNA-binding domain-containing protein [Spirosomataceae bacterium]